MYIRNFKLFAKAIIRNLAYVIYFPFASLLLFILNLFRPVRVEFMITPRLGHLALNTELLLRRKKLGIIDKRQLTIFVAMPGEIANTQLYSMWKRQIIIIDQLIVRRFFMSLIEFNSRYLEKTEMLSGEYFEYNNADPILSFTPEEIQHGDAMLAAMGISEKDWFVCVGSRDSAYLTTIYPHIDFTHNDHRDADIDTYIDAVKYIIEQGGWVLRIGKIAGKRMNFKHERFIDYTFSEYRSDFMDIFLQWKCKFVVANTSGLGDVAKIFDTPFCGVNNIPIDHAPFGKHSVFIPKKLRYEKNRSWVSLNEYLKIIDDKSLKEKKEGCFLMAGFYKNEGLDVIDNSPEEILGVVKEMYERLGNSFRQSKTDKENQERYQEIHSKSYRFSEVITPIGKQFLIDNPWFIK